MYSRIYDTNVPYVHCSTETFATLQCVLAVALLPVSINPRPPPVSTSSCNSECFFQYVLIKCCVSQALPGGGKCQSPSQARSHLKCRLEPQPETKMHVLVALIG